MWPHLQPHKFMTAAVLIAKPKYNWVMRNKFIVHWPRLRITALDVCVLQIINKTEHAHTPICAKCSSLAGVRSEGAGMCQAVKYLCMPLFAEWLANVTLGLSFPGWGWTARKCKMFCSSQSPALPSLTQLQNQVLFKPKSLPVSAPVSGMGLCWSLLQPEPENSNLRSCGVCNTNKRNL